MTTDLFPNKKFIFTKINGVDYISKDAFEEILKSQKQKIIEEIDKTETKTYYCCDCGDYDEGCVKCLKRDILKSLEDE
jgi:hypothetical protein